MNLSNPDSQRRLPKSLCLLFFFFSWAFYALTCCRNVGWIDSALHVHLVYKLGFGAWVNRHNLFYLLGWLWTYVVPFGNIAYRVNLFCAFCGALTVFFIFLTGIEITRNRPASLWGALCLMFSHSLWWHSTITEVYTLNTALLALTIYCIARFNSSRKTRELYAACFFFGLACSNHVLMWLFLLSFAGLFYLPDEKKRLRQGKTLFYMLLFFLAGFQLYLIIFLRDFYAAFLKLPAPTPGIPGGISTFTRLLHEATGGNFKKLMFPRYDLPAIESLKIYLKWHLNYLFLLVMNYPSAALIFGFIGFSAFWKKREWRATFWFVLLAFFVNTAWAVNYHVWDQYAFGLPSWVLFGLFVIVGLDYLWKKSGPRHFILILSMATVFCGPILYGRIPHWAKQPGFWNNYFGCFRYTSNMWDASEYFASPYKHHYDLVPRISESIFRKLPPGAILYDSDDKGIYPLKLYFQDIYKIRPDIQYVAFWGPTATEAEGRQDAQRIIAQLGEGKEVFISSLYWPEWIILRHLYLVSENKTSAEDFAAAYRLKPEELIKLFKHYRIKKIPLLEGQPYCIYKIEPLNVEHRNI